MSMEQQEPVQADVMIAFLDEGYVISFRGYSVAVSTPSDLAAKVLQFATTGSGMVDFQPSPVVPTPVPSPHVPDNTIVREPTPTPVVPQISTERDVEEREALAPSGDTVVEWENIKQATKWLIKGFRPDGYLFTRKDWDDVLSEFAPHVNPKLAEHYLSEAVADDRDGE